MLKAILILPGFALVIAPTLILWLSAGGPWTVGLSDSPGWWLAALSLAAPGLGLMIWTIALFERQGGGGTLAPWAPIRNFIVAGPYRHTRNPMLTGVLLVLLAEATAFRSWALLGWAVFFLALNTVYFIRSEEPGLERRFGETYRRYKRAVPRWAPRRTPYDPDGVENSP